MRILTRYLLRAHLGPFLFALSALTGLLFLNALAQRLEDLAGKGLPADVIWEFVVLSLPHTVALTLPMAVLVAVLYAFTDLTDANEITALKAGGVRPQRMMVPLLVAGVGVAAVMLFFNARVLPEANHQLANLLRDISRKSPTFALQERVVNEVQVGEMGQRYYITAARIDNRTNELEEVAIYDLTDPAARRTTYAERGEMAFNEGRTDLYLTLFDGVTFETDEREPGQFQQAWFERQILPLRGVGDELTRRTGGVERGDREMTLSMLDSVADLREAQLAALADTSRARAVGIVREALGREAAEAESGGGTAATGTAVARPGSAARMAAFRSSGEEPVQGSLFSRDDQVQRLVRDQATLVSQADIHEASINRARVEIHKKWALAVACLIFVLLGPPLALRFPRGGLGLVIAASSAIFALYWSGLIGGETLADRDILPPGISMWIPNAIFLVIGLWLFLTMGREASSTRGGGEWWYRLTSRFRGEGRVGA